MGCLAAPFRLLGSLGLIVALAVGWYFRDVIAYEAGRLLPRIHAAKPAPPARAPSAAANPGARPGKRALVAARAKVDSLNGWRADSVVLTAAEAASLLSSGLDASVRSALDSMQVELKEGEVVVRARLRTDRIPREALGPLASVLGATEPVRASGPVAVVGKGQGIWTIRSFSLHDLPVPRALIPRVMEKMLGGLRRDAVPWRVPAGVRRIRIQPTGVVLYGTASP